MMGAVEGGGHVRILVADDHVLVRAGLAEALTGLQRPVETIEAEDAAQTRAALDAGPAFHLILLDLFMPGATGLDLLSDCCRRAPATPVVVLSASEEPVQMRAALDHGAAGFIPKSAPREVLLSALELVLNGGCYIPAEVLVAPTGGAAARPSRTHPGDALLTRRQREVLAGLTKGYSNKRIAADLGLAENTVKVHVAATLRALEVRNRTEAVSKALTLGLGQVRDAPL